MLQLEPTHWYSWDFTLSDGGSPVAAIDFSTWRERGELTIQGQTYQVTKQGLMSGGFRLEWPGGTVATAARDGLAGRRFHITHGAHTYTIMRRRWWGRDMVLLDGDREIGWVVPAGAFTRRGSANLPEQVPLPVRVFMVWIALLVWKREAEAAHAAT